MEVYTADQVTELLAAERAKLDAEIARLNAHEDYNQLIISKAAEKVKGLETLLTQAQAALNAAKNVLGKMQPDSDGVRAYVMAQDVIEAIDKGLK